MDDNTSPDNKNFSKTSVKKAGKILFLLCSNSFLIKKISQCTVIQERSKKVDSYLPPGSYIQYCCISDQSSRMDDNTSLDNTKRSKTSVKKLFLLCSNSFLIKNPS